MCLRATSMPRAASWTSRPALALALERGPVSCSLDRMPQDLREALPTISPNVMLPFTRHGIDPFRDRFEIVLRGEGTVRGIGGLRVADDDCQTTVPGLFVAGDAASRERVAGAVSGGGSINSAWALSSGLWAGAGAARHARDHGATCGPLEAAGELTLRSGRATRSAPDDATLARIVRELQTPMLHPMQILFRQQQALTQASELLEGHWQELQQRAPSEGALRLKARQTAAMVASARWITLAAQTRRESRGMHLRSDLPHRPGPDPPPERGWPAQAVDPPTCRGAADQGRRMIALLLEERCTHCQRCVQICPALVFDARPDAPPVLARPDDCQTCFACELYCQTDALYVDPSVNGRVQVEAEALRASGLLGVYRRDSGWDEWADDPRYANQHWRMEEVFARGRELAQAGPPKRP